MTGIPDLDLRKIHKYAARVVPRDFQDQIRMEVDVRGKTVTIVECRPPWVARMKFDTASNEWTLYWSDRNSRWHIFDLLPPVSIDEVLEQIERDQTRIFWG